MTLKQYFGWNTAGNHQLFTSEYRPSQNEVLDTVIVAPPIGPEYMHCKAALRQLCLQLAEQGFRALTFDWPGYGNSSGEIPSSHHVSDCQQALTELIRKESLTGIPSLIVLRSASLLAIDAINQCQLNSLFFWYPYTQGKAFVRDLQLIDRAMGITETQGCLTAGGYPLSIADQERLTTLTLNTLEPKSQACHTLHMPDAKRLGFRSAFEHAEIPFSSKTSTELRKLARQAEYSVLPVSDIACIVQTLINDSQPPSELSSTSINLSELDLTDATESVIQVGDNSLFGVMTRARKTRTGQPCLLIPNTGAGHHVGPNRIHTTLARTLAQHGVSSLRFDLSHLGNSGPRFSGKPSSHAYTEQAADDLHEMIKALHKAGFAKFSLFGICSGAHTVFQYLRRNSDKHAIEHAFLVNANRLYWSTGDDPWAPEKEDDSAEAHYHQQQMRQISAWWNLLKSPQKWLRLTITILNRLKHILSKTISKNTQSATVFERDCERFSLQDAQLHFVFSPDEPGERILSDQSGALMKQLISHGRVHWNHLVNGDHTFTRAEDRTALINHIVDTLSEMNPLEKQHQGPASID